MPTWQRKQGKCHVLHQFVAIVGIESRRSALLPSRTQPPPTEKLSRKIESLVSFVSPYSRSLSVLFVVNAEG